MNPLRKRPWFFPLIGASLYLSGMNDMFLHVVGGWWLDLGRWTQTVAVLALLALGSYVVTVSLNRRHSAYRAAILAADATRKTDEKENPLALPTRGDL